MPSNMRRKCLQSDKVIDKSELAAMKNEQEAGDSDSSKAKCEERVCDLTLQKTKKNANSRNIINMLDNNQRKNKSFLSVRKASRDVLVKNISSLSLFKSETPFDRRITFIEWHPKNPETLAVASKGGDILLCNYRANIYHQHIIRGKGAGGAVQAIKFHPQKEMQIYTTAIDGTVASWDYESRNCKIFLETNHFDKWYTSLDVNFEYGHFVTGDNTGYLTMVSLDGKQLSKVRLHKNKITHAEYNAKQSWLLTTASVDRTVKLWDTRCLTKKALAVLHHDYGVNSAYFSITDSSRILTTDQQNQLRIYKGPLWQLETIIHHPHRHFQHLTPIKASWHPLEDLVIVGRYPDDRFPGYEPGELRTIDFFDADTGKHQYGLSEEGVNGIISLNQFNILGDTLASGMGIHILIWRPNWENDSRRSLNAKFDTLTRVVRQHVF